MKLDARQLVARVLPRREEDPPPPYSASDPYDGATNGAANGTAGVGVPLTRSISPRRPLPTPPAANSISGTLSRAPSTTRPANGGSAQRDVPPASAVPAGSAALAFSEPNPTPGDAATSLSFLSASGYTASPGSFPTNLLPRHAASPPVPRAPTRHRSSASTDTRTYPSPPYGAAPQTPPGRAALDTLPLGILHRILMYALDPRATPDAWAWDIEMERVRRLVWLARDFRAVDRRFFQLATSILRERMLPTYRSLLQFPSSDPLPPPGSADMVGASVFAQRSREAAVLDRFVATRLGEDLRRAESALCEDSGEDEVLFSRLQPAARVEDLLLRLPETLVAPAVPGEHTAALHQRLPLPHAHIAVTLSPLWAQLWLSYTPITPVPRSGTRAGRSLVVEVRKAQTPEDMVRSFGQALELLRQGKICWGWSYRSST